MDATSESRHKEMLDQILAMATKMASDLKACNVELKAAASIPNSTPPTASATASTPSPTLAIPIADSDDRERALPMITATELVEPPISIDGHIDILSGADGGGVDRLSALPDSLLRNIVSRLPIKDAGRTAVLSRRWGTIWRAAPLLTSNYLGGCLVTSVRGGDPNQRRPVRNFVRLNNRPDRAPDHAVRAQTCDGLRAFDAARQAVRLREAEHAHVTFATGLLHRSARTPADLRIGIGTTFDAVYAVFDPGGALHSPREELAARPHARGFNNPSGDRLILANDPEQLSTAFQFGVSELLIASSTRCSTLILYQYL